MIGPGAYLTVAGVALLAGIVSGWTLGALCTSTGRARVRLERDRAAIERMAASDGPAVAGMRAERALLLEDFSRHVEELRRLRAELGRARKALEQRLGHAPSCPVWRPHNYTRPEEGAPCSCGWAEVAKAREALNRAVFEERQRRPEAPGC